MTASFKTAIVISIFLVMLGGYALFSRLNHRPPNRPGAVINGITMHAHQIAQEAAAAGRVVSVKRAGQVLATYRCKPDDAAVAVMQVEKHVLLNTGVQGIGQYVMVSGAHDESGHSYQVSTDSADGKIYFVALKRGFGRMPGRVIAHLQNSLGTKIEGGEVVFSQIAPPIRLLSPPVGAEREATEKFAIAEVRDGMGGPMIRFLEHTPPGEFFTYEILQTSFSNENFLSGTALDSVDAVKVRVSHMKMLSHSETITYHDAIILKAKGYRLLTFPITEVVGNLGGLKAQILKFTGSDIAHMKFNASHGTMSINLSTDRAMPQASSPQLRFVGIKPSLETMGLDWLVIRGIGGAQDVMLHATPGNHKATIDQIPNLTLHFEVFSSKQLSVRTLVLPVHHMKSDPKLFPKATVHSTGGPSSGPMATRPTPVITKVGSALH